MKLNARVVNVAAEETIQFRTGPMRKKTIIVEEAEGSYPAQVAIDWWGDKADLVKNINAGDVVVVEFKIESRPSARTGRPFTAVNGREIALAKLEEADEPQNAESTPQNAPTFSDGEVAPF